MHAPVYHPGFNAWCPPTTVLLARGRSPGPCPLADVPKVAGGSKAVRIFGPEYAPSLFSGLVPCGDALWIRPGSGGLKHRLANAESRNAHLPSLPTRQHPLRQSGCWRRQPAVLRDDKGRVVDRPGIATRTIATPRTGLSFALPAPAAPRPGTGAVAYAGRTTTFVLTGVRE